MTFTLTRRSFLTGTAALISSSCLSVSRSEESARPKLPIPALVDGTQSEPIDMTIRKGAWAFRNGVMTPTLGFNQNYLGPTIRTRRNSELNLNYHNTLSENVSVHGHGLHVPGNVDGGPQLAMSPGENWRPSLNIAQPAATCWYHSHTHGSTGSQVYRGLAGMMIIDDDESDSTDLPNRYGVDDLPVIIQDRTFDTQGRLVYSLEDSTSDGWYGDTVAINGAMGPVTTVPAGKVRLRILNGANARFYIVGFADNRTFHKIATDGGLLAEPVPLQMMEMAPGERCEIIVDLTDGNNAELLTLFEDDIDDEGEGMITGEVNFQGLPANVLRHAPLTLVVDGDLEPNTAPLPANLTTITRPTESNIVRTREFLLEMEDQEDEDGVMDSDSTTHSGHGGHGSMDMMINGAVMDMNVINERVNLGEWERWRVRSNVGAHPFHVHGCSFLIESMEGSAVSADQRGWKDTVVADDDDWSEFIVRFDHAATRDHPYMYHCHILEHEDQGMMGQFTVS